MAQSPEAAFTSERSEGSETIDTSVTSSDASRTYQGNTDTRELQRFAWTVGSSTTEYDLKRLRGYPLFGSDKRKESNHFQQGTLMKKYRSRSVIGLKETSRRDKSRQNRVIPVSVSGAASRTKHSTWLDTGTTRDD
ncbi:hypothetical protein B9Z55_020103 [Caenorhabditis nigoni]|uniref:Uncharacterized protein n=1 Tax=Caenorhabditis nigoni TaxID=1611254 RepID=A0A2G5TL85_9PELO|nr:hypothetical protein B9Z55_020103 [Caenorhabditis nigoni]